MKWTEGWLRAYFKSETEVSVVDERKHSFRYKSTAIIFDKVAKVMNYLQSSNPSYLWQTHKWDNNLQHLQTNVQTNVQNTEIE